MTIPRRAEAWAPVRLFVLAGFAILATATGAGAQALSSSDGGSATSAGSSRWFPDRALIPDLFGPRDPAVKAQFLHVFEDPSAYHEGPAGEVALGSALPVLRLAGSDDDHATVLGLEAGVFARFTLKILQRELVATDWVFAVPLIRHIGPHWIRVGFFHTSSHLGDEYANRFDTAGANVSRDAAEVVAHVRVTSAFAAYAGSRYAYNVHPWTTLPWSVRVGAELVPPESGYEISRFHLVVDAELDQNWGWAPRVAAQLGFWLPPVGGRRRIRTNLELLTGPSPLGQFQGRHTTQLGFGFAAWP